MYCEFSLYCLFVLFRPIMLAFARSRCKVLQIIRSICASRRRSSTVRPSFTCAFVCAHFDNSLSLSVLFFSTANVDGVQLYSIAVGATNAGMQNQHQTAFEHVKLLLVFVVVSRDLASSIFVLWRHRAFAARQLRSSFSRC